MYKLMLASLLMLAAGCEQLNPEWCDKYARCSPDEFCDPATNTCMAKADGGKVDQRMDLPRDTGKPDRSVDATSDAKPDLSSDKGPAKDVAPTPG